MFPEFLITFRETLEAALIVGIILAYLAKVKQSKYNNIVYLGVGAALIASIIGAILFSTVAGGFEGRAEQIFEGTTMLLAAVMLTFMILWMMRQRHIVVDLHRKVSEHITTAKESGIFFLVFISVLREGIETVIFLGAASFVSSQYGLVGGLLGVVAAIGLGYAMFVGSKKINLKKFFRVTSILLVLFAAGLVAHGIHEYQEAGLVPIMVEHVWDINPAVAIEGVYPMLHEKGVIGSLLKGLFGYNGNPSLIEVLSYIGYLILIIVLWQKVDQRIEKGTSVAPQKSMVKDNPKAISSPIRNV